MVLLCCVFLLFFRVRTVLAYFSRSSCAQLRRPHCGRGLCAAMLRYSIDACGHGIRLYVERHGREEKRTQTKSCVLNAEPWSAQGSPRQTPF